MFCLIEAYIRGQRIQKVYVDGGAQVCVMSEKMINRLGLEVHGKTEFKAKMANNVSVKCVGVCRNVKIVVCGIKVRVDLYVLLVMGVNHTHQFSSYQGVYVYFVQVLAA